MGWAAAAPAIIGAVGSIAGGLLGNKGGSSSQSTKPWKGVRPYLRDLYAQAGQLPLQQYYPGQSWINPLPSELSAYGNLAGYNNFMYGSPTDYLQGAWNYPQAPTQNAQTGSTGTTGSDGMQYAGGSPDWIKNNPGQIFNPPVTTQPVTGGATAQSIAGTGAAAAGNIPANANGWTKLPAYYRGAGGTTAEWPNFTTAPNTGTPEAGQYSPAGTPFGQAVGAMQQGLGGNALSSFANNMAPYAQQMIGGTFAQGPGSVNMMNPYAFTPQFGQAGGLDATGALNQMLSGQGDYSGLQASIDAANAPILRQLNQDIIPGLNQRATFLNNETGGIKSLNRIMPDVAQRMSENAATLTEAERQRALASQQAAAGLVSQGGLSAYGLGLQGSGLGLQADTTNANLLSQYRGDVLGLGNLAAGTAGDAQTAQARWAALFPGLAQAGQQPYQDQLAYGAYQRQNAGNVLADYMNRWNFAQQSPYTLLAAQQNAYSGYPTQTTQSTGGGALGTLGGALTGGQLASMLGSSFGGYNITPISNAQAQQAFSTIPQPTYSDLFNT